MYYRWHIYKENTTTVQHKSTNISLSNNSKEEINVTFLNSWTTFFIVYGIVVLFGWFFFPTRRLNFLKGLLVPQGMVLNINFHLVTGVT